MDHLVTKIWYNCFMSDQQFKTKRLKKYTWCKTKKINKSSHLRSCNQQVFVIFVWLTFKQLIISLLSYYFLSNTICFSTKSTATYEITRDLPWLFFFLFSQFMLHSNSKTFLQGLRLVLYLPRHWFYYCVS